MKDDRQFVEYERPNWPPEREPSRPPFSIHRMDLARSEARSARTGQVLVAMMVVAAALGLAVIGWTLWGSV